jgi:tRNA 2-(methylsulfanyl)-N6-isopentenyladenosine37 hydroxylase
MLPLEPTSPTWVAAALADLPRVLVDHAHCESKAATTALRHAGRHPAWPRLALSMSRLAREELVHFERVLRELERLGIPFRLQAGAGYASGLQAAMRPPTSARRGGCPTWQGDRTVDEMLVCALIEARSHERLELLAGAVPDERLAGLYKELCEAEARHGDLYLELAEEVAGGPVTDRLAELTRHEAAVLARPGLSALMHAGG